MHRWPSPGSKMTLAASQLAPANMKMKVIWYWLEVECRESYLPSSSWYNLLQIGFLILKGPRIWHAVEIWSYTFWLLILLLYAYINRGGREGEGEGVKIYVLNIKITVVFRKYTKHLLWNRLYVSNFLPIQKTFGPAWYCHGPRCTLHPSPTLSQLPVVLPGAGSPPKWQLWFHQKAAGVH